jgi:hypothetical protein
VNQVAGKVPARVAVRAANIAGGPGGNRTHIRGFADRRLVT